MVSGKNQVALQCPATGSRTGSKTGMPTSSWTTKRRPGKTRVRPAAKRGGSGRAKASPLRGPPVPQRGRRTRCGWWPRQREDRGALETPPVDGEPRPPPRTATPPLARHAAPDVRPRCAGRAHRLWRRRPARLQHHHPHVRPGFPQQPHPRVRGGVLYISVLGHIYLPCKQFVLEVGACALGILWPPLERPHASSACSRACKKKTFE